MRPPARRATRGLAVAVIGTAALGLAGCGDGRPAADAASHAAARSAVADVSRGLYRGGTDLIDDYARWADADTRGASVELIGYEAFPGAEHGEPFGALQFRASVQRPQQGEPYVACFESEFDFWGVVIDNGSGWDDDAAVARDIECPPGASRIPPPVDTRTVHVVPEGAEAVVVEVLTNAPVSASADAITAEIVERMPQPTGEREAPFEPETLVVDGEIGFAMGDADDCLLVKRDAAGVQALSVPGVLLQPGELGCSPATALRPVDQLRSPH